MSGINGGPAFPSPEQRNVDGMLVYDAHDGMSLRDYFATHAPGDHDLDLPEKDADLQRVAEFESKWRYIYADAMLEARKHGK